MCVQFDKIILQVGLSTVQALQSNGVDVVLSELVTPDNEDNTIKMVKVYS